MFARVALWLLLLCLALLGAGGIYGGGAMLLDPWGQPAGLPPEILARLPVDSYHLPGLFLLVIMGLTPLLLCYALWRKPDWPIAARMASWRQQYWAWNVAFLLGITLLAWLVVEYLVIGYVELQAIMFVQGLLMLGLLVLPSIRQRYTLRETT